MRSACGLWTILFTCFIVPSAVAQEDPFQKASSELQRLLDLRKYDEAIEVLESTLQQEEEDSDFYALRLIVASRLVDSEQFKPAMKQYEAVLKHHLRQPTEPKSLYGIVSTLASLQRMPGYSGAQRDIRRSVNEAFDAIAPIMDGADPTAWTAISPLVAWRAQNFVDQDDQEAAKKLLDAQTRAFEKINAEESPDCTDRTMLAQMRFLATLTDERPDNDDWRMQYLGELDDLVVLGLRRFPKSRTIQNFFANFQFVMISQWLQEDPEARKERIQQVMELLEPVALRNRTVDAALTKIEREGKRLERSVQSDSLVGKPAPAWEVDAWVNLDGEIGQEQLKGKVVLLDFWALWCGPCIATFPHLKEWREEYAEQGFEIVGVTQYYNYQWDPETLRAARSSEEVDKDTEQGALLQFLRHHELDHPTMIVPESSEMHARYGVRGIPHAVVIDQEGIVQLVVTGAGAESAKQLEAKIRELLGIEEPADQPAP